MHRTDLVTPFALGPSLASRRSTGFLRLSSSAILFASCAILFAAPCRAQSQTQTTDQATDQDVAEAARQQRARKEVQQKKSPHVYTEEDLKHAQILTPEDRAQVVAKKNQQTPPPAEKSEQAVDAQSLPSGAPLGDVARHFRQQKQLQKLQQSAQFHLPIAAPALASPQPPVVPAAKPPSLASPKPLLPVSPNPAVRPSQPRLPIISMPLAPHFAPYRPPVKRSPFARPKFFTAEPTPVAPARPSSKPELASSPRTPAVPKLTAPLRSPVEPKRIAPAHKLAEPRFAAPKFLPPQPVLATPSRPIAELLLATPVHPLAPKPDVPARRVKELILSLPKLPALDPNLFTPTPLAPNSTAPPRPAFDFSLAIPARPAIHSKHLLPPRPRVEPHFAPSLRSAVIPLAPANPPTPPAISSQQTVVTVQRGDSLWKLAKQNLGSPLRWRELLSANPSIHNPNLILAGSQIVLPPANSHSATNQISPPCHPLPLFNVGAGLAPPVFSISTESTL